MGVALWEAQKGGKAPYAKPLKGFAGAGVLVGAFTGVIALAQAGELKEACTGGFCPPRYHDLLAAHRAVATTATTAFAAAGVAASVGAVAWLVDASSAPAQPRVGVRWTGTGVALGVGGTWP